MIKDFITNPENTEVVLQWFIILIIFSTQVYILQKSLKEASNRQAGLLTSLGIFGTFLGICVGLWYFDPDFIQESVKGLLGGLKIAFLPVLLLE